MFARKRSIRGKRVCARQFHRNWSCIECLEKRVLLTAGFELVELDGPVNVESTFDTDAEGWTVLGDGAGPTHVATGGNSGGFIQAVDQLAGAVWYWAAPAQFLGDQSSTYRGNLSFDLAQSATTNPFEADDVVLTGAGLRLVYDLPANPGLDWTSYRVPLLTASGWRVDSRTGATASEAQLQTVLASLTGLHIRGEYQNGSDTGRLDNVHLASAPAGADLDVTISDSPDPVFLGGSVTYTITVTNHGLADATGVVVTNTGPPGGQFISVTVPMGDLLVGESKSFQTVFQPASVGTFTNTAVVTADQIDPNVTNNSFTAETLVQPPEADVSVTVVGPADALAGETGVYTVTVTNHGPSEATDFTLRTSFVGDPQLIPVPAGFAGLASFTILGQPGEIVAVDPILDLREQALLGVLAPLAPGASAEVAIPVRFLDRNGFKLRVDVFSQKALDPDQRNNSAFAETSVTGMAFQLDAAEYQVREDAGSLPVTITRTGSLAPATVRLDGEDGTALAGVHYEADAVFVHFAEGQATARADFPIFYDRQTAGDRRFQLQLIGADRATYLASHASSATITIFEAAVAGMAPEADPLAAGQTMLVVSGGDRDDEIRIERVRRDASSMSCSTKSDCCRRRIVDDWKSTTTKKSGRRRDDQDHHHRSQGRQQEGGQRDVLPRPVRAQQKCSPRSAAVAQS